MRDTGIGRLVDETARPQAPSSVGAEHRDGVGRAVIERQDGQPRILRLIDERCIWTKAEDDLR